MLKKSQPNNKMRNSLRKRSVESQNLFRMTMNFTNSELQKVKPHMDVNDPDSLYNQIKTSRLKLEKLSLSQGRFNGNRNKKFLKVYAQELKQCYDKKHGSPWMGFGNSDIS